MYRCKIMQVTDRFLTLCEQEVAEQKPIPLVDDDCVVGQLTNFSIEGGFLMADSPIDLSTRIIFCNLYPTAIEQCRIYGLKKDFPSPLKAD